jgi:hypothetical protein
MKILWALGSVSGDWVGGFRSKLASNRYRGIIPARELHDRGCTIDIVDFTRWPVGRVDKLAGGDVVVIGKFLAGKDAHATEHKSNALLESAVRWRSRGVAIVVDFCDDHFNHNQIGPTWRALARDASLCVAGSDGLADRLRSQVASDVVTIGDPLASPARTSQVWRAKLGLNDRLAMLFGRNTDIPPLRLAWYGHLSNWPALRHWALALATIRKAHPWHLRMVTVSDPGVDEFVNTFNSAYAPRAHIEFVPWSEPAQWQVVADSHIVLLPSKLDNAQKTVKTANRLTDALNAGCYVIATPLPAYLQFKAVAALSDDVVAEVKRYLRDPDAAQRPP